MSVNDPLTEARRVRNDALDAALRRCTVASHEAEIEYSETVAKLRERFETDLADAIARRTAAVRPAQRAYNAAVIRAEQTYRRSVPEFAPSDG